MKHGEEDDERRNGKQQCDNVSVPAESVARRETRGKTKKKRKYIKNLYAIHAKCVTIIPEDIQIASQYLE